MKIGVVSDTHIPRKARSLPLQLMEGLKGVELIIHAGDIGADYVVYELEELAPVEAVAGNVDEEELWWKFGRKKLISAEGMSIGIIHGDGVSRTTLARARKAFTGEKADCIVFGHSHIAFNEVIDGILCFNPGSPTDKRRQNQYSYGLLQVSGGKITGEVIFFD